MDDIIVSNKEDFKNILGKFPLQIGVGCTKNKKIVLDTLWNKGSRLIDLECSFEGENDKILNNFIKDKKDFVLCQQFPLWDEDIYKETNIHIYEADDKQLEYIVDTIINKQLEKNNVDFYHIYLLHSVFSMSYYNNYLDDINLYIRIFKILKKYKDKGVIQHLGYSANIDYPLLELFTFSINENFRFGDIDIAMVPINIFSDVYKFIKNTYNINMWNSPGERGIEFLKSRGYTIICMTPFERGELKKINTIDLKTLSKSNYEFLLKNKNIDYILLGTSSIEHINEIFQIYSLNNKE